MVDKTEADNDSEGGDSSLEQKRSQHKQLLREVIRTSKDVNNSVESLIEKIGSGPDMSDGISFLDLKNDLMINYNLNLLFLLMKKTRDGKIETERGAVERLCHIRTVLEKVRPIEHKLKYQIDKCVNIAETGQISKDDPARFKANPDSLASKFAVDDDNEEDGSQSEEEANDDTKAAKKYVAPKNVPAYFNGDKSKEEMESEVMVRKKKAALSHSMMRELRSQLYDTPEEISHQADVKKQKYIAQEREKEIYEEENFIRLPVTKEERKAKRNVFTVSNVGDSLTSFGNSNFDGTQTVGGKRKKSSGGKTGGKGNSKKKFKKKKFH